MWLKNWLITRLGCLVTVAGPRQARFFHGSAILIRHDLKFENVYERVQGTVELITVVMPGVVVHSVYKSPNTSLSS